MRKRSRCLDVGGLKDAPAERVLQREQAAAREVEVIGLDRVGDVRQRQAAVRLMGDGLRLDAAEYGAAAGFVFVGVRYLCRRCIRRRAGSA